MGKATVASYDRTVEAHIVLRRQSFTHWYGPGIDTGPEDVDIDHLGFEPPFFGLHIGRFVSPEFEQHNRLQRTAGLRLACAVSGRSAQQLVTDALDAFLETMPELDSMADKAPLAKRA